MRRLVLVPLVLFAVVSGATFALAQLHPAKPEVAESGSVELGDAYRGQITYSTACAGCHGAKGEGGIGPALQDAPISLAAAKSQIDNGGGSMPAGLVSGQEEEDLLAYLATILAGG